MKLNDPFRQSLVLIGVVVLGVLLAIFLQTWRHAWQDDFGGSFDEPAHYVMALTAHDYYLANPLDVWPVSFAKLYYLHYPKIAFGHWPPLFHIVVGAWMLLAGTSRAAVLILLSILTGITSGVLFVAARKHIEVPVSLLPAILFPLVPLTQQLYSMVMLEIACALASLVALIYLARFFEDNSQKDALWFAFWTTAAILTKPNAWALGLAPFATMLLANQGKRLREVKLWLAGGMILLVCVPFYAFFFAAMHDGTYAIPPLRAFFFSGRGSLTAVGVPVFLSALVGIAAEIIFPLFQRKTLKPFWTVMFSGILSVVAFFSVIPGGLEIRHLFILVPPMLLFAGRGVETLAQLFQRRGFSFSQVRVAALASLLIVFFSVSFRPQRGYCNVFGRLAAYAHEHFQGKVYLVSSSENGEGRFIAEFAATEPARPDHILLRGTKLLATETWAGGKYATKYTNAAAVESVLDDLPVSVLILHTAVGNTPDPHQFLLQEMVAQNPREWQLAYHDQHWCPDHGVEEVWAYVNSANVQKPVSNIQVDLGNKLNLKYSLSSVRSEASRPDQPVREHPQ